MPEETETDVVRPFAAFLQEQRNGLTHTELSEQLNALVAAVIETGKKGSLGVTFTVKPASRGAHTLVVSDVITFKPPAIDRNDSIFFATADNNLSRRDPNQPELPLRSVGSTTSTTEHEEHTAP